MERAEPPTGQNRVKKQLHMGAARWRCPRYCSERSAWLDRYVRNLLTPARCAELPLAAREAGQHWPRRRSFPLLNAPLAGSDDAEARRAASGRSGGFAQSCGWCWSFDRGRSDPRSRHPQGSCGRFARVLSAMPVSGCLRPRGRSRPRAGRRAAGRAPAGGCGPTCGRTCAGLLVSLGGGRWCSIHYGPV